MAKVTTILIAEDDENDIFFLKRILSRVGDFQLHCVYDGSQAMRYLNGEAEFEDRAQFPAPDCLILDLGLPQKNGLELLAWLKNDSQRKKLPVMVCTGLDAPDHTTKAYDLGAISVVKKPAEFSQLSSFIEQVGQT